MKRAQSSRIQICPWTLEPGGLFLFKPTADVDVLLLGVNSTTESLMRLAGKGSALHKKCGVYLQVVGIARIPLNYHGRLTEMIEKPLITFVCLLSTHSETSSTASDAYR
jgi:hypothetical protein